jgi:hypothetical protein
MAKELHSGVRSRPRRRGGPPSVDFACFILLAGLYASTVAANAQSVPHLTVTQPGGMPGWPVITGIQRSSNGVTLTWDGPSGYYRVHQKKSFSDPTWQVVNGPNANRQATISILYSNAFFRVSGPSPRYAGSQACLECHSAIHNSEMDTRHARALDTLKAIGQGTNASCLPCHTVGFGLPTGFISESRTPKLAGVQCENCHGPAAAHAANEMDLTLRPRVEIASTVCGGCHTGSHHPTFDEWYTTGHAVVVEDMNPANRINSCGRCHSGSSRLSLINNKPLPVGDANMPIDCVVCHDPHRVTGNPAQLRNPVASTNDYFLTTSESFTNKYNPNVNICAQCHNHRGASYTSTSRAPHHSPQYNMLLGTVGVLASGVAPNQPGSHGRLIQKQCVGCHMQSEEYVSEAEPALTGHKFKVETFDSCYNCHPFPELLAVFTTMSVSNQVQQLKAALDLWATTKAPESLRTKYGARAWEYTTPGDLSPGGSGPSSSEQALIPANIQKARFNLYIVLYDGSFGVHNGPYTITLIETAMNWVQEELNK